MRRKIFVSLLMALALAGALPAPADAAGSDAVHSSAEWASIKTVLNTPADWAYFRNQPASPAARMKKDAGDCPPIGSNGNPGERLCLWNGYSYQGTLWQIPKSWLMDAGGNNPYNGLSFYGSGINNASKGWWNRTYQQVTMFDNDSCQVSGWYRRMSAGQFAVSDNAASNDWENRISSASLTVVEGEYCYSTPGQ